MKKKPDAKQAALDTLDQGVTDFMTSDGWKKALQVRQSFHNYSYMNTLLSLAERPDATSEDVEQSPRTTTTREIASSRKPQTTAPKAGYQFRRTWLPISETVGPIAVRSATMRAPVSLQRLYTPLPHRVCCLVAAASVNGRFRRDHET